MEPTQSTAGAHHPEEAVDLALELANPVADLVSLPFQFNYDTGLGEADSDRWILNIQPVIPVTLSEKWNLISRTIVPVIDLESPGLGGSDASGVGDILQSLFFSPRTPGRSGWIWGVGPAILLPVGSDAFTSDQWGLGPSFVALKQTGGWSYGGLVNHIWGLDAPSDRDRTNNSFFQPFVSYTTPTAWTCSLNSESTYDWNSEDWTMPVNLSVSKLVSFGSQPVSFQAGYRYYLDRPPGGPDWGLRFNVTLLFPK